MQPVPFRCRYRGFTRSVWRSSRSGLLGSAPKSTVRSVGISLPVRRSRRRRRGSYPWGHRACSTSGGTFALDELLDQLLAGLSDSSFGRLGESERASAWGNRGAEHDRCRVRTATRMSKLHGNAQQSVLYYAWPRTTGRQRSREHQEVPITVPSSICCPVALPDPQRSGGSAKGERSPRNRRLCSQGCFRSRITPRPTSAVGMTRADALTVVHIAALLP